MKQRRRLALAALLVGVLLQATHSVAQTPLSCGDHIQGHLNAGEAHAYSLQANSDAVLAVQVVDRSSVPSLLRIKSGSLETCSGALTIALSEVATVEISDCIGNNEIDYTINANVVSGGPASCARPLPCGLVPRVYEWMGAGAVDSFRFSATSREQVILRATDMDGERGSVRLQVFDPEGIEVNRAGTCSGEVKLTIRQSGVYTVLASACIEAQDGRYQLGYRGEDCPAGPEISYLGLARSDNTVIEPSDYDGSGRPIYTRVGGAGFSIVVEATPGASGGEPGLAGFNYDEEDPTILPDLQVLLSSPLGNGNPEVCADDPEVRDGIPATTPLVFAANQTVADAINDFGCRVNDGTGHALGVGQSEDACTTFADGSNHFVASETTAQYCAPISSARQFPVGATVVAARVRDSSGAMGPAREMIVQIQSVPTNPPTPSRSPTPPTSPTPTRTPVTCAGDCDGDRVVSLTEILSNLRAALTSGPLPCASIDTDTNGIASIEELVRAVHSALAPCQQ